MYFNFQITPTQQALVPNDPSFYDVTDVSGAMSMLLTSEEVPDVLGEPVEERPRESVDTLATTWSRLTQHISIHPRLGYVAEQKSRKIDALTSEDFYVQPREIECIDDIVCYFITCSDTGIFPSEQRRVLSKLGYLAEKDALLYCEEQVVDEDVLIALKKIAKDEQSLFKQHALHFLTVLAKGLLDEKLASSAAHKVTTIIQPQAYLVDQTVVHNLKQALQAKDERATEAAYALCEVLDEGPEDLAKQAKQALLKYGMNHRDTRVNSATAATFKRVLRKDPTRIDMDVAEHVTRLGIVSTHEYTRKTYAELLNEIAKTEGERLRPAIDENIVRRVRKVVNEGGDRELSWVLAPFLGWATLSGRFPHEVSTLATRLVQNRQKVAGTKELEIFEQKDPIGFGADMAELIRITMGRYGDGDQLRTKDRIDKASIECAHIAGMEDVLCVFFSSQEMMKYALNRAVTFIEREGSPLLDHKNFHKVGDTKGNDLRAADLLRFLEALAEAEPDFEIPENEMILRKLALETDFLNYLRAKLKKNPNLVLIAIAPVWNVRSFEGFLSHEFCHARYFTDAKFREKVWNFWENELLPVEQEKLIGSMSFGNYYDPKNKDLMINEFQAYMLMYDWQRFMLNDYSDIRQRFIAYLAANNVDLFGLNYRFQLAS